MNLSDFDFVLPKSLIAHSPSIVRDQSRLLVVEDTIENSFVDKLFCDIIDYINPGDLLILNNSKVIKARVILSNNIDLYLHESESKLIWIGYVKPAKKIKSGDVFHFDSHTITVIEKLEFGKVKVAFKLSNIAKAIVVDTVYDFLEQYGSMPLPPYIKRKIPDIIDNNRYQTVFANFDGSVAAPTAGLHFTEELLQKVQDKGANIDFVTLHVGAGTFLPIKTDNINDHYMHSEEVVVSEELIKKIKHTKSQGKNVIAVGTTVLRALESAYLYHKHGVFKTNIFIKPRFKFRSANMLITNFHLPKSTLLILVSTFAGCDKITDAYRYAIENEYRFFSYGDAMLLFGGKNEN